ncbi:MAG TPA: hypothetical protein VGM88_15500 [Kofleriaceae bacterium]|jgi:hypothetical protein
MSNKTENKSPEIETLPAAELETANGGWWRGGPGPGPGWGGGGGPGWGPYGGGYGGGWREARFMSNHPWAARRGGWW